MKGAKGTKGANGSRNDAARGRVKGAKMFVGEMKPALLACR